RCWSLRQSCFECLDKIRMDATTQFVFFFQAEDGIRDRNVTGVQTCALPICMHMMFNFYVNQHVFYTLASADVRPLEKALEATQRIPQYAQWASFLRNHDELDLGRLTKQQRQLTYEKFGPDKNMQLYGRGIRRRLAPMLGNRPQLEMAYSLMFSLPGTPVLRYGDEIGMGEDLRLSERN